MRPLGVPSGHTSGISTDSTYHKPGNANNGRHGARQVPQGGQPAIGIMEHRGGEQGAERAANAIAPALPLSQYTAAYAQTRSRSAFYCAPKRSVEEIVKQTTA